MQGFCCTTLIDIAVVS